jgi:helicase associated protein
VAHVDEDGYQLGTWVANQGRKYARNELPDGRIVRLEKLHGWTWKAR